MKILILKPSSLGDVILALPVLRQLKQKFPASEIHWWISEGLRPLLEHDPDISGLFLWRRKRWSNPLHWGEVISSVRAIRQKHFDFVLDLQGLARSAIMGWFAHGTRFVGLNDAREGARAFYDTILGKDTTGTHAADWYQKVLPFFGIIPHTNFTWLPKNNAAFAQLERDWQVSNSQWILLNPGARWLNKRWPVEYFAQLARKLSERGLPHKFAVLGGVEDREAAEKIAAAVPGRSLNLAARTTLPELIEWLRLAKVMVSNDTGPVHIAAALGTPVVGLYGPTDPGWTGPYRQGEFTMRHPLVCSPCNSPRCSNPNQIQCLREITPDRVAAAVVARL